MDRQIRGEVILAGLGGIELIGDDGLVYVLRSKANCTHIPVRKVTLRGLTRGIKGKMKGSVCGTCGAFVRKGKKR